jgi:hypothetical protein
VLIETFDFSDTTVTDQPIRHIQPALRSESLVVMSENKICLRLLGLSLAPRPGVTQRYIAKNRPSTWHNVPLTRHHGTRVFSAIEFSDTTGSDREDRDTTVSAPGSRSCPYREKYMLPTQPSSPRLFMGDSAENRTRNDLQFPLWGGADCTAFHRTAVALCRNSRSETTAYSGPQR